MKPSLSLHNAATTHNNGIDIVRVAAMCMIVAMHMMMQNMDVIRESCSPAARILLRFFYAETFSCVNLFVLATGWLYAGRMPKIRRVLELACMVLFFDIGSRLIVCPFTGQSFQWWRILHEHWFWNVYLALVFLIPVLNCGLEELNRRWGDRSVLRFLFLVSFVFGVVPINGVDSGRTLGWFVCLYLFGSQLRFSSENIKFPRFSTMFAFAIGLPIVAIGCAMVLFHQWNIPAYGMVEQYQSPIVFLSSVFLFIALAKTNSIKRNKLLRIAATASFSVYLVHTAAVVRPHFFDFAKYVVAHSSNRCAGFLVLPAILSGICMVYLAGIIMDLLRKSIFNILRIDSVCKTIERFVRTVLFDKWENAFSNKHGLFR